MASIPTEVFERGPVRVRMSRRAAYTIAASFMAVAGTLFSTAAFAAGVNSVDVLAMLFALGASGALLMLLLWYLAQLQETEA